MGEGANDRADPPPTLPMAALALALDQLETDNGRRNTAAVRSALERIVMSAGVRGARIDVEVAPQVVLALNVGDVHEGPDVDEVPVMVGGGDVELGTLRLYGGAPERAAAATSLQASFDLAWSHFQALSSRRRLAALEEATVAVASERGLGRVLQLIVDLVRPLVGARYAALGIVSAEGRIETFITSGMDGVTRDAIGHLPVGRGLLGVIVRESRTLLVEDVMTDPRRAGFPPYHPPMHTLLGVPVTVMGTSIGNLYLTEKHDGQRFTLDDARLVETFARHAGIAIRNARQQADLERMAVVEERERIGQDLHDGVIQSLYAVGLSLEDVPELMTEEPREAEARVERAIDSIHSTIRDLRNFIFGLRPESLEDGDLAAGLATLANEFQASTLIQTDLNITAGGASVPSDMAVHLIQLAREALSNVARHSGASRVSVQLMADGSSLRLTIADNGSGFDQAQSAGPGHRGLGNMQDRATSVSGSLSIESGPTGTTVTVAVPLAFGPVDEETMA
jgi:two-component system, NarL family, sensor histidine kinase DevS